MSAEKLRPARVRARLVYDWMGRYPRKGADWSPEEDQALLREYESGRHLVKEIAARHLREPVAIERRLSLLRDRAQMKQEHDREQWGKLTPRQERNWQTERETAQQAVSKIKGLFSASMWPGCANVVMRMQPGEVVELVGTSYIAVKRHAYAAKALLPLTDLPPEVAQALQFGGES